jgi:ABC-type glycerol-3-phosphate transport system substrate-binding protein
MSISIHRNRLATGGILLAAATLLTACAQPQPVTKTMSSTSEPAPGVKMTTTTQTTSVPNP